MGIEGNIVVICEITKQETDSLKLLWRDCTVKFTRWFMFVSLPFIAITRMFKAFLGCCILLQNFSVTKFISDPTSRSALHECTSPKLSITSTTAIDSKTVLSELTKWLEVVIFVALFLSDD